jgi:hypothetical protein
VEGALIYVKVGAIDAPFIPLPERNAQQMEACKKAFGVPA